MIFPKSHGLIGYKVEKFINNSDFCMKSIIKKLLDNTIYISFEIFMLYFIKNFKNFDKNENLFIYITDEFRNKSNYWIYQLMIYYKDTIGFKENLIIINDLKDERLIENSKIIIPDDCIYSGEQMRLIIEEIKNSRNLKLDIYLFISFMTNEGLNKIKDEFAKNSELVNCKLNLMKHIYYINKNINYYLNKAEIKLFEEYYSIKINKQYLIYFDHKMPDDYSSLPLLYSGIVANFHNKILLNLIRKQKKVNYKDELMFIQFIDKTDNIRNINIMEPELIKPPYK